MTRQHVKSPCCDAKFRRFGPRRRQCISCKKTWTSRPRKRGRPAKRLWGGIVSKVLLLGYPLKYFAKRHPHLAAVTFRHHFRRLLQSFVAKPRTFNLPPGPLILLMDGLWARFGRDPWVLYQVAVKPVSSDTAHFLDPVLIQGKEGMTNWEHVLSQIPQNIQSRTVAIVVDNLPGFQALAQRRGWSLQLCHFHLLIKFYGRQRMLTHALKGGPDRLLIHKIVRRVLASPEGPSLDTEVARLHRLSLSSNLTPRLKASIRHLLASLRYYRAYYLNPHMRLPTTTNAVESMGARIRAMLNRHKAASSPRSLLLWATALTRLRPNTACNANSQQN